MRAPPPFTFCIDTDSYAGGFQREACAYVTGAYGDCGVGSDIAEDARADLPDDFYEKLDSVSDANGCFRPCAIGVEPVSGKCHTVELYFAERPTDDELVTMVERAQHFSTNAADYDKWIEPYEVLGCRLVETIVTEREATVTIAGVTASSSVVRS